MYVRTPKRYRGPQRRSGFSCRRIVFIFFAFLFITVAIVIYQNIELIQRPVQEFISTQISMAEDTAATAGAPTATATRDPVNLLTQGNNFWSQGSMKEALNSYLEILDSVPNDVEVYERITLAFIILGQIEEALPYAEQTVNADPYSSDAWAVRAWALDWNERPGEAISSALHALELDPDNPRAMSFLAEAYNSTGQSQRALLQIEDALEINPDSFEAYRARALVNWNNFDLDAAVADLRTAYDLAPNMSHIAIDIATIESARGNHDEAIIILEDVVENNPQNTQALFRLGYIHNSLLGNPSQAIGYLSNCVDYNASSVSCQYLLGRVQYRLELYNEAALSFEKAIILGTENPYHYYWAGWSQINIGNCAKAMSYLEPGYDIATSGTDAEIVEAFEVVIPECRTGFDGFATPIPTETPDPATNA